MNIKKQLGFTAIQLALVVVLLVGVIGWIANIIKLAGSSFDPITGMLVLRCIGIFVAPLGSILGFL